jgi:hypothetical protein
LYKYPFFIKKDKSKLCFEERVTVKTKRLLIAHMHGGVVHGPRRFRQQSSFGAHTPGCVAAQYVVSGYVGNPHCCEFFAMGLPFGISVAGARV